MHLKAGHSDDGWDQLRELVYDLSDPHKVVTRAIVLREPAFAEHESYASIAHDALAMTHDLSVTRLYLKRARDLSKHPRARYGRGLARRSGAALAYGQRGDALEQLLPELVQPKFMKKPVVAEVLAAWLHGHIARGRPIPEGAQALQTELTKQAHPLSGLPLFLHESEVGALSDPKRSKPDPLGNWFEFNGPQAPVSIGWGDEAPAKAASAVLPEALPVDVAEGLRRRCACGLVDEDLFPNGTWEVRLFNLAEPLAELCDYQVDALPQLGSLRQAQDPMAFTLIKTDPATLPQRLIWLATMGGAYGESTAAYGRLHAWRALEAWVGLPESQEIDPNLIMSELSKCQVGRYSPASSWQGGFLECGFMVLRPGGKQLVVFAMSDTD